MKFRIRLLILVLAIFMAMSFILAILIDPSQESIKNPYIRTKALCNSTNYCQDYKVTCQDSKVINLYPITGAAVQFSDEWQDPRNETTIYDIC